MRSLGTQTQQRNAAGVRGDLPQGTVTFLFTDVEGSTRLLHELGPDRYAKALAHHRRVVREAVAAHGGVEVDTQGDAFFVAFPTADGAAAAALSATEALADGPIRVRMALHTGAPTLTGDGYVGLDVHRGARVAALAHGGQILVSPTTAALLGAEPLHDLGQHRLKDFDGAIRLSQLGKRAFPPLRTPGSIELPSPATRFLGREQELFDAVSLVYERDPRVLTILGPGGTGKTRFALELARLLADEAEGGTVFVPLAPLRDPELVLPALADRLGAASPDPPAIAARVGERRTHVVCDNVEHLLPAVARPLAEVAVAVPALRVFATSREALRIQGEAELDLPPLVRDEAVVLFCERAEAVRPGIRPTEAVAELCERLDRLPLALELAAARTKLLAPELLLERIGERLDILKGTRDADERHATLRATIAWSYDLLDEDEQRLLARLSVFRGGCTLETAEAACDAELDTLASLIDKSLLRRRTGRLAEERYWMLETIKEFATERLEESGDAEPVRRRHAERMLEIVRSAHLRSEDVAIGEQRPDRVLAELDDVREALEWALSADIVLAAELFTRLEMLLASTAPPERLRWAEALLETDASLPPELRARVLRTGSAVLVLSGEPELGQARHEQALALFRELGDDYNAVELQARFVVHHGPRTDPDELRRRVAEVRSLDASVQHPHVEPQMLSALAELAEREKNLEEARALHWQSIDAAVATGFVLWELWQLTALYQLELVGGTTEAARAVGRRALMRARELRDHPLTLRAFTGLAVVAARQGDLDTAGRLWGLVLEELPRAALLRPEVLHELAAPIADLTDDVFLAAVEAGRSSTIEEAVALALGEFEWPQAVP
jgi:predicted ATPase/class 3 adenylate cyclase